MDNGLNVTELRFELPHLTIAGYTNNNIGKPVLLLLHGWLDNAGSFEPLFPWLSDYHVIAVDFPGHGLSDHRSVDANYHFVEWIYDIAELIRINEWQELVIVGHSMGGMVATVVASVLPEKINQLILIEAIGMMTTPAQTACDQLRKAIQSRQRVAQGGSNSGNSSKTVHPSFESALAARVGASDFSQKEASILLKRGLQASGQGFIWRTDQRLRTHSAMRFSVEQANSFVTSVKCPVLLIEGENGFKQISQNRQLFGPLYTNLTVSQVPGGHHCHMEYPAQVWQAIAQTL